MLYVTERSKTRPGNRFDLCLATEPPTDRSAAPPLTCHHVSNGHLLGFPTYDTGGTAKPLSNICHRQFEPDQLSKDRKVRIAPDSAILHRTDHLRHLLRFMPG